MNKNTNEALLQNIINELTPLSWNDRLIALNKYTHLLKVAFSTSFSFEDQIITHIIATNKLPISIFTIDTGRLFEETHQVFQKTHKDYSNIDIKAYYPNQSAIQKLVEKQGTNGFYDSKENRYACCNIRKVKPLNLALKNVNIWISGLRKEHSSSRENLPLAEYDASRNIIKLYPIIDVKNSEIQSFIKENNITYNILHDKGYPSIGCSPCTRAVKKGDDSRSGRWWWEASSKHASKQASKQECGLHLVNGEYVTNKNT